MPSKIVLEHLASVFLAVMAGLICSWAASRYGQTNKRYLISGFASLGGITIILLYQALTHRWNYLTGDYLIIVFALQWAIERKTRKQNR